MVFKVHLEPLGVTLDVEEGERLIEAAWRQGYFWPTTCHGDAQCGRCFFEVEDGSENLTPPDDEELETLDLVLNRPHPAHERVRLACRTCFTGDAVVRRRGPRYLGRNPETGERLG